MTNEAGRFGAKSVKVKVKHKGSKAKIEVNNVHNISHSHSLFLSYKMYILKRARVLVYGL